ncbi:MAG: hypothetical protein KGI70_01195 [Patescibacteria group bacterium]|nr:hypothetical protein [Patescibacteria group bacterium]
MNWQRYIIAFVITGAIFATAFYIANRLDAARVADIQSTQTAISIDILSTETQFELLGSLDCEAISQGQTLSSELSDLASRLSVAEQNLGINNTQVVSLKKQYSLLEIKDYLLMRQISARCRNFQPVYVLYFYSNSGDCPQCTQEGEVLTYLRTTYPDLRVYAFDYNLDLPALKTLIALRRVDDTLPAIVVQNRAVVYGLKDLSAMQKLIPELKTLATTTPEVH